MKIFKKIVAVVSVVLGFVFLMNSASDIQIGFGAVLVAIGLLSL